MNNITHTDRDGNKLIIQDNKVYLYLITDDRTRNIGFINGNKYCKYVKENHVYHKGGDKFSFNYHAIELINPTHIKVNYKSNWYSISKARFDLVKEYKHFKTEGFELQCMVAIDEFIER